MGLSVTNAAAVIGDAATLIPIDAIQEFNTQVNPKAEFGWKPGAITSVGLKSGTNDIHGTAYGFGRSDSLTRGTTSIRSAHPRRHSIWSSGEGVSAVALSGTNCSILAPLRPRHMTLAMR